MIARQRARRRANEGPEVLGPARGGDRPSAGPTRRKTELERRGKDVMRGT
jgi:hypothetical protein